MFKEFMHQTLLRPKSSESAGTMIFSFGAWARKPLFTDLDNKLLKIPVMFLFGDDDWIHNHIRNDGSIDKLLIEDKLHP